MTKSSHLPFSLSLRAARPPEAPPIVNTPFRYAAARKPHVRHPPPSRPAAWILPRLQKTT